MILKGNQRGGAKNLALHLLKEENDHVELHELRGFVSNDLVTALNEAYFISKATKAKQFLFSLSLNPPANENVSTETFENAIERIEKKLGLVNQPRAIVFHEKNNRRHAHVAWSRIYNNGQKLKAVQMSHSKLKLMDISRELYIENKWQMPKGMLNAQECNPKNFTHQQWQQAKRIGKNPRAIKQIFQECWAVSDSKIAFANALKSRGYILAKGDRRGFVTLDHRCEIFSVSKWSGIKVKEVKEKLGNTDNLPSVTDAQTQIAKDMSERLTMMKDQQQTAIQARMSLIKTNKLQLLQKHRKIRKALKTKQEARQIQETKNRQDRYNKGIRGILDRITGKHTRIKKQNEQETLLSHQRDMQEKDQMIFKQMEQSQKLQNRADRLQEFKQTKTQSLSSDIKQYREIETHKRELFELRKNKTKGQTISAPTHER